MAILPLCTWGHPVLKTRAQEVGAITDDIRRLVKDMFDTLAAERGVGLAANQVGEAKRIFVAEVPGATPGSAPFRCVLINPVMTKKSRKKELQDEGCLSFPGIYGPVERAWEAEIEGQDLDGKKVTLQGSGLLARAFQHELDHLDGIVFIERMNVVHRLGLAKELKALARQTKARLAEQKTKKF